LFSAFGVREFCDGLGEPFFENGPRPEDIRAHNNVLKRAIRS
jgi:hypothetical protein